MITDWRDRARCLGYDPEIFFPGKNDPADDIRAICADCPVREQCLAYAVDNRIYDGIYGGMLEEERRRLWGPRCEICGAVFTPAVHNQTKCSDECRRISHMLRERESAARRRSAA